VIPRTDPSPDPSLNQPNEFYSHERLLNQFEKIFTTPITPVSAWRYSLQIDRWIPVLKNRPNQ